LHVPTGDVAAIAKKGTTEGPQQSIEDGRRCLTLAFSFALLLPLLDRDHEQMRAR